MSRSRYFIASVGICLSFALITQSLIVADDLSEVVATLQVAVQNLQGQVKSCDIEQSLEFCYQNNVHLWWMRNDFVVKYGEQPLCVFIVSCDVRRPVFMATLSNDLLHCSMNQTVIFNGVKVNQGSGYDSSHGTFRAPVAGMYGFATTLSVMSNNQYHVAIVKGDVTNEVGYLYTDPSNIWLQRSTTIFTHMNQNEQVWMICLYDSRIEGDKQHGFGGVNDYHSHFSGFLVTPD